MKQKLRIHSMLFICISVFLASNAYALTISSLYGDIDSFGTGVASGSAVRIVDFTHESDDGLTDLWDPTSLFNWGFNFSPFVSGTITSATLTIVTIDMEDNGQGDGLGGEPYDDKLFLDGIELVGAFDEVYTSDANIYSYISPNVSVFNLDSSYFTSFNDGILNVQLNSYGGTNKDFIAIDYALLTVNGDIEPVPEPASMLLFGTGIVGLAGSRLRRKKK